jgi:bifunctional DNase/RNase
MTHDLLANTIKALGAEAEKVVITHIVENTFYSEISLIKEGNLLVLDSRPSDSIAIAVRLDIPIYVSESVMSTAKMVNVEKDEKEAQKFKDFIDNINPDDFKKHLGND